MKRKGYSPWRVCTDGERAVYVLIRDVYRTNGVEFYHKRFLSDAKAQKAAVELNGKEMMR